jgi:hypothetical protein
VRRRFCKWFLPKSAGDRDFPARVLAADEVCFTRDNPISSSDFPSTFVQELLNLLLLIIVFLWRPAPTVR